MIDLRVVRENPEAVRSAAARKRIALDLDRLLARDRDRREILAKVEELRSLQNRRSKEIAKIAEKAARDAAVAEMKKVAEEEKALSQRLQEVEAEWKDLLLRVPNLPAPEVPEGETEAENVPVREWGEPPRFDFEPKDHVALGEALGMVDIPRGVKIAGARSYVLRGDGVLLEQAVLRLAIDRMVAKGFTPLAVPVVVKDEAMVGTGYFPGGEEQAYRCERDGLSLVGTGEVSVTAYRGAEILAESELPLRYVTVSPCFRREAGSAGRDTKGLYRVHQFTKVEQVVVCAADEALSRKLHEEILRNAEEVVQALELPYRVVDICVGELGLGQVQKFDIECWMPSRDGWGETHSASRFHDFQARRLNLRYRTGGELRFCHTLNNTVIASPRILIALLEVHQQGDGSVRIPAALRPYLGGREALGPR